MWCVTLTIDGWPSKEPLLVRSSSVYCLSSALALEAAGGDVGMVADDIGRVPSAANRYPQQSVSLSRSCH